MKKTILVIDNDTASASIISKTLEPEGYLVFSASGGDAAIAMAKKVTPMLIFLNLATPGTGLEICKSIRNIPSVKDSPIVLLTIRESKFDPRYKSLYGIVDFLKKPFTADNITSRVNSILTPEAVKEEVFPEEPVVSEVWDLNQPEVSSEEMFEDFKVKKPEEMFEDFQIKEPLLEEESKKEPFSMPVEEEVKPVVEPTPAYKEPAYKENDLEFKEEPAFTDTDIKESKPEPVKHIKEPDEFFAETEETAEVFTPVSEPVLEKEETAKKKKRLRVPTKRRSVAIPAIVVIAVAIMGFVIYSLSKAKPQLDTGRRPAEVMTTADMPSKPLKKPQVTIQPEVILADVEVPTIELKEHLPKKQAYYVQFGAFSSEQNAKALVSELKTKGEETFIQKGTSKDKQTVYRVLSPMFDSKKTALNKAQTIREKKIQTTVFEEAPSGKISIQVEAKPQAKIKPGEKQAYYVQFGTFSSEKNAKALVSELKTKGEETFIQKGTSKNKQIVYRVLSAKPDSKKAALSKAQAIKDTKKIQTVVFTPSH